MEPVADAGPMEQARAREGARAGAGRGRACGVELCDEVRSACGPVAPPAWARHLLTLRGLARDSEAMADLGVVDKAKFEKLFGMSSGYVLDFSSDSFHTFVVGSTGKEIFSEAYAYGSGSKANRLRAFWTRETNIVVGQLLHDLLEYLAFKSPNPDPNEAQLRTHCRAVVDALRATAPVTTHVVPGSAPAARRDVFLCHASEDKPEVVDPLFAACGRAGVSCWYDRSEVRWGDSLIDKINEGLAMAQMVLVVLSPRSVEKHWPRKEVSIALNREINRGTTSVLPLIVGSTDEVSKILQTLPIISDKLYRIWKNDADAVASELKRLLSRSEEEPPQPRETPASPVKEKSSPSSAPVHPKLTSKWVKMYWSRSTSPEPLATVPASCDIRVDHDAIYVISKASSYRSRTDEEWMIPRDQVIRIRATLRTDIADDADGRFLDDDDFSEFVVERVDINGVDESFAEIFHTGTAYWVKFLTRLCRQHDYPVE